MKKKILLITFFIILIGAGFAFYLYNKPHQSIADETPAFVVDAKTFVSEYESSEEEANKKYLGKIIEVSGTITEKSEDSQGKLNVTLEGPGIAGVGCSFEKKYQDKLMNHTQGQQVKIKGICTGILMDVVLVDCVLSE